MTSFEQYVKEKLEQYDEGRGDMAHDILYDIQAYFEQEYGNLEKAE